MSTIEELERAVRKLSPEGLAEFRLWFVDFDARIWDAQLETDVESGCLDPLAEEVLADFRQGRTKAL